MRRRPSFRLPILTLSAVLAAGALAVPAVAQPRGCCEGADDFGYRYHLHDRPARSASELGGQDALSAIQEVVGLLLGDPTTDWSQVSIARLRRHLADLERVTLFAEVEEAPIDSGLRVTVSGDQDLLEAARRAVLPHAERIDGFRGWRVAGRDGGDAIVLELTTDREDEVEVLRALGFYGFLASGVHRPHELLAVARGVLE